MDAISTPDVIAVTHPTPAVGAVRPVRIVLVCTANRCRSPLAEHLLRAHAGRAGLAAVVSSMGLLPGGCSMPRAGLAVAAEMNLDVVGHLSRTAVRGELASADLVLTMERFHARELIAEWPWLMHRTFTLRSFTSLTATGATPPPTGLAAGIASVDEARPSGLLLGDDPDDAVADPMGRGRRAWRATARELDILTGQVVETLSAWTRAR